MDNDNKINSLQTTDLIESNSILIEEENKEAAASLPSEKIENEIMLFLGDELAPLRRTKKVNVYDLQTEYEKTGKNIRWSVWGTLIATTIAVILVTIFTISGLSKSNDEIDINISSIQNLGLQNLFSQLQKAQENYDEATKRRAELKGNLDAKLNSAKLVMENDLELLESAKISDSEKEERTARIKEKYNAEVITAHAEFDAPLSAAETQVKQFEEQLKNFDSENVSRAQKYEQQMDSARQVYELERNKMTKEYESMLDDAQKTIEETKQKGIEEKMQASRELTNRYESQISTYDPVFDDETTSAIISNSMALAAPGIFSAEAILTAAGQTSEGFASAIKQAQANYENLFHLYQKASTIPQKNTMKSIVPSEQKLSYNIINALATSAAQEIQEKNTSLTKLTEQTASLEQQVQDATLHAEELDKQIATLEQEAGDSKQKIAESQEKLALLESEKSGLEKQISSLQEQLSSGKEQIARLESQTEALKLQIAQEREAATKEAKEENEADSQEIESYKNRIAELESLLKSAESKRDIAVNSGSVYRTILNSSAVEEDIAGFIIAQKNSEGGAALFIRNAYRSRISSDGSTKANVYSGQNLVTSGFILQTNETYYFVPDSPSDSVSPGNSIKLSK